MDISTIRAKLKSKQYTSSRACIHDFNCMFNDCFVFNMPGDDVVKFCIKLELVYKMIMKHFPQLSTHNLKPEESIKMESTIIPSTMGERKRSSLKRKLSSSVNLHSNAKRPKEINEPIPSNYRVSFFIIINKILIIIIKIDPFI